VNLTRKREQRDVNEEEVWSEDEGEEGKRDREIRRPFFSVSCMWFWQRVVSDGECLLSMGVNRCR